MYWIYSGYKKTLSSIPYVFLNNLFRMKKIPEFIIRKKEVLF